MKDAVIVGLTCNPLKYNSILQTNLFINVISAKLAKKWKFRIILFLRIQRRFYLRLQIPQMRFFDACG
jgi:hypothetical protein